MDRLDDPFGSLPWHLDRDEVAPGVPPEPMTPRQLRNWLLGRIDQLRDPRPDVDGRRHPRPPPRPGRRHPLLAALGLAETR
ncbi:hypothetical protein [Micromonospora sp. Llam0]|uniref:hypothetical protein n=1 Tax=Micromonospora sp. Llam0 TaxID=2485143 RepID=UPI0011CD9300|nr:hypothetical protein [Micromonospora sp. Llam0]